MAHTAEGGTGREGHLETMGLGDGGVWRRESVIGMEPTEGLPERVDSCWSSKGLEKNQPHREKQRKWQTLLEPRTPPKGCEEPQRYRYLHRVGLGVRHS